MVRKAIALAVASMISLSGPALAADAKASAQKAAVAKADTIQRAGNIQDASNQIAGSPDFLVFLAFGLLTIVVVGAAMSDDEEPTSP